MSITLKERLELIKKVCEEGMKNKDLSKYGYILGMVDSTLGTIRPDIRKCLDEPSPAGWYYLEEEESESNETETDEES